MSLLRLSRRQSWWKDAEILMLRHQLAAAEREQPKARARLTWPDRAWLALLAGTVPAASLAGMRLLVTPGTILRWHRDIVRRRWRLWAMVAGGHIDGVAAALGFCGLLVLRARPGQAVSGARAFTAGLLTGRQRPASSLSAYLASASYGRAGTRRLH